MVLIILGSVFGVLALVAVVMAVRNHNAGPSVVEQRLAALDRLLTQRGVDADIFVNTKPIEVAIRGSRAADGRVSLEGNDAFIRLSKRAPLWVRDGVLRVGVDETGIEKWTDADVDRVATDVYVVVSALQRRAAAEVREISKPNVQPKSADVLPLKKAS
jgi:hypothetical protein